jgi:hypothetical protein
MDASIWFNKQCQTHHVTPKYAQIHLNNTRNIKTNIFRNTPIQMAIKPTNTISCLTRGQYYTNDEFEKSGIYILSYHTCRLTYIGHMVWDMSTRYKEHYWCIKTNNSRFAYALLILKNRHEYGILPMTIKLVKKVNASMRDQVHAYAK